VYASDFNVKKDIKRYYMLFQIQDRNPSTKDMHPTAISIVYDGPYWTKII